ncbi:MULTISPECIES: hypothetical protein [unclassified Iodidimonas]|jgi:hypothetical protein|uniref:hypothetical protein n=1 Tax=unclassified Iodidimonas TaxID=2626145 RepID=UPI00248317B4|nr:MULTISPECIES: hypothetical protein [unclassified Iodidimonas]
MALALPTFLLFILILPGIIFKNAYNTIHGEAIKKNPLSASFINAVLSAAIFHIFFLLLVCNLPIFPEPDLPRFFSVIAGNRDFIPTSRESWFFLAYMFAVIAAAYICGTALRRIVDDLYLEYAALWFNPYFADGRWAAILRGPILDKVTTYKELKLYLSDQNKKVSELYNYESFENKESKKQKFDDIWNEIKNKKNKDFSAVIIEIEIIDNDKIFAYSGIITDFKTDDSGELLYIVLKNPHKKSMDNPFAKFEPIQADRFQLNCTHLISAKIDYENFLDQILEPFAANQKKS